MNVYTSGDLENLSGTHCDLSGNTPLRISEHHFPGNKFLAFLQNCKPIVR